MCSHLIKYYFSPSPLPQLDDFKHSFPLPAATSTTEDIRHTAGRLRVRPLTLVTDERDVALSVTKRQKLLATEVEEAMADDSSFEAALLQVEEQTRSKYDLPGDLDLCASIATDYPVDLNAEQGAVWLAIESGRSIFFTGPAGTGKSYFLRRIIAHLKSKHRGGVFVTAPTGVAACNIGGSTIHRFAGIGLGDKPAYVLLAMLRKYNKEAVDRWQRARVLIIDEVSMLHADLLDKLDFIARRIRPGGLDLPFGGLQVVASGDFFQLPPITERIAPKSVQAYDSDDERDVDCGPAKPAGQVYCFESQAWKELMLPENQFSFTKIYRQTDETFTNTLNEFRIGSSDGYMDLFPCVGRKWADPTIVAMQLFPHRVPAEKYNREHLDKLRGKSVTYRAVDSGEGTKPEVTSTLNSNCSGLETLVLKIGAEVILLRNLDLTQGLCNGARGRVVRFEDETLCPQCLVWNTGDDGEEKKENGLGEKKLAKHNSALPPHPVVKFDNGEECTIIHDKWDVTMGEKVIATRLQVPLDLAWAITIHKSQGMTISYLEVELTNIFEAGQAYVALSRVTSIEGLRIRSMFDKSVIWADEKVIAFYDQLARKGKVASDAAQSDDVDSDDNDGYY